MFQRFKVVGLRSYGKVWWLVIALAAFNVSVYAQWSELTSTSTPPAKYVVKIITFWPDGQIKAASGSLIGRKHVLTAGHVLYDQARKMGPSVVMVTPGAIDGKAPYGSANAAKWAIAREFLDESDSYIDFGIILLNRDLGTKTGGWFALNDWTAGWEVYNGRINGYPAQSERQITVPDRFITAPFWVHSKTWINSSIAPQGGVSGGPLWFNNNGSYRLVGIYTRGGNYWASIFGYGTVSGLKLTKDIRVRIQTWVNNNP